MQILHDAFRRNHPGRHSPGGNLSDTQRSNASLRTTMPLTHRISHRVQFLASCTLVNCALLLLCIFRFIVVILRSQLGCSYLAPASLAWMLATFQRRIHACPSLLGFSTLSNVAVGVPAVH